MPPRRRTPERHVFLLTLVAFLLWTAAVAAGQLGPLDASVQVPLIDPRSTGGQIAEAFALVTHPFGLFALTLMLALWAHRRRLRRLALALTLSTLGLPAYELVAMVSARMEACPFRPFRPEIVPARRRPGKTRRNESDRWWVIRASG